MKMISASCSMQQDECNASRRAHGSKNGSRNTEQAKGRDSGIQVLMKKSNTVLQYEGLKQS